jgi:hypothetical protein
VCWFRPIDVWSDGLELPTLTTFEVVTKSHL